MTDLLGSIGEGVGKALSPLAPAVDFLAPQVEQGSGLDLSPGGLINQVGRGAKAAFEEGLFGVAAAGVNALQDNGMSARERLLLGGMALAGGAMSARAVHTGWKANKPQRMYAKARPRSMPGRYDELTEGLGDPKRFIDVSEESQQLLYERPGVNRKQAQILAADEPEAVARGFLVDSSDPNKVNAGAGLFQTYADRAPEGAFGAQVDWARFSYAMDNGIVRGTKGNRRVKELWKHATEQTERKVKGQEVIGVTQDEAEELFGYIQAIGDATDGITSDSFEIGLAGRVTGIDFVDGEPSFFVSHPVGWNDGMSTDPYVRAKRLSQLNIRELAPRGKRMLTMLFDIGDHQYNLFQELGTTDLPKGMKLGRDWYPVALDDTSKAFDGADGEMLDRAVAAVSFLSEAEEWSTNVYKARRILDLAGDVSDEDFQAWLRHGVAPDAYDAKVPRHKYAGTNAAAHEKRFKEIWEIVKKGPPGEGGFKVDETTMKKVLRLYGGVEPVMDVFRSTKARKQKNFYLNIRYPDGDWPVTIDRHAYDAFYGLDAGVQDRPIDVSLGDGDQQYDVIADTYRSVAQFISERDGVEVLPHQVQAVIWEVWRILKGTQGKNGWGATLDGVDMPTPFMMTLKDEVTNPVFDALMGRTGLTGAIGQDLTGPVPLSILEAADVSGLQAVSVGNEYVVLADLDDKIAATVRSKTPGVAGQDRVWRWIDSEPLRVQSIDEQISTVMSDLHWVEHTTVADHRGGVHPALRPEPTIVAYVPDGKRVTAPKKSPARKMGRATVETQDLDYTRLGPEDINPDKWGPGSSNPLSTHAWAAFSVGDADPATINRLRVELQRRGYKPIDMEGFDPPPSGNLGQFDEVDADRFHDAVASAQQVEKNGRKVGETVARYKVEEYDGMRTFLSEDGLTGFAVKSDGDLVSVFNVGERGRGESAVRAGIEAGASKLDAFDEDGFLPSKYKKFGFEEVGRDKWDPDYAPAGWQGKTPDVVYMQLRQDAKPGMIAFGVPPREAREIAEKLGLADALTNAGAVSSKGRNPTVGMEMAIPPPDTGGAFGRTELILGDKRVNFRQDVNFDETEVVADEMLEQNASLNRQRVEIAVPEGEDISLFADDLEKRGFQDLSIYANVDRLNGFDRAYDRVMTDGAAVTVVRTQTGAITDPHGSHVFVRSNKALPKQPKKAPPAGWEVTGDGFAVAGNTLVVDGRFPEGNVEFTGPFEAKLNGKSPIAWGYADGTLTPIFDDLELNSGRFQATIVDEKITPADELDMTAALRAHIHLRDAGYPDAVLRNAKGNVKKMVLDTSEGKFPLGEGKATTASAEVVTTRNGLEIPRHHTDRPVGWFEEQFALELEAGWRSDRQVHQLSDMMIGELAEGTKLVYADHQRVIQRARLRGISTENMDPKLKNSDEVPYAYFNFAPDQRIVLTREFWENPTMFTLTLRENRAEGWLSPRVEATPRSIMVHELGHVMHLAARMGENMTNRSQMEVDILELVGGKRKLAEVGKREISTVAGFEVSELIAESVSEVLMADRPSKLARDVYDILTGKLGEYMRYHDMRPK